MNDNIEKPVSETEIEKTVETLTIGKLLKQKRVEKDLTIKVISQQTKIHLILLENLENDRFDKLPSKTYLRGFVKSCAKLLQIDQEYALELLEKSYHSKHTPDKEEKITITKAKANSFPIANPDSVSKEKAPAINVESVGAFLKVSLFIAIGVVFAFNVKNFFKNGEEKEVEKLPEVLTAFSQKNKNPLIKKENIAPAKPLESKVEEPLKINIIDAKKEMQNSEVVVQDVSLKKISSIEKQFTLEPTPTKEELETLLPERFRVAKTKGTETLFINAVNGDSWVTYKVDDKEIKKFVLRQGRTLFLRGGVIRLFIGNTKNVKMFYNNDLVRPSSNQDSKLPKSDEKKNIVLPEELKTKYMSPLFVFQKDGSVVTSDSLIEKPEAAKP